MSNKGTNERSPTCHGRQHETKVDTKCQNVSKMPLKGCFQNEFTITPHIYRIRVPTNGPQLAMDVNMKPRLTQSVKMCPKRL